MKMLLNYPGILIILKLIEKMMLSKTDGSFKPVRESGISL